MNFTLKLFLGLITFFLITSTKVGIIYAECDEIATDRNLYRASDPIYVSGTISSLQNTSLFIRIIRERDNSEIDKYCLRTDDTGKFVNAKLKAGEEAGRYHIKIWKNRWNSSVTCFPEGDVICQSQNLSIVGINDPCVGAGNAYQECDDCIKGLALGNSAAPKPGAWTALGCIDTSPQGFVTWLLQFAIGIAGGIAFLLMLWGAFTVLTSSGNPEKLNSGKEIIVSAIAGLIMILFSVFLLKVIGVDILGIPGFK